MYMQVKYESQTLESEYTLFIVSRKRRYYSKSLFWEWYIVHVDAIAAKTNGDSLRKHVKPL